MIMIMAITSTLLTIITALVPQSVRVYLYLCMRYMIAALILIMMKALVSQSVRAYLYLCVFVFATHDHGTRPHHDQGTCATKRACVFVFVFVFVCICICDT